MSEVQWSVRQNAQEFHDFLSDLSAWEKSIAKSSSPAKPVDWRSKTSLPPIRTVAQPIPQEKIKSYDYRSWDKFDVEKACEEVETRPVTSEEHARIEKDRGNFAFKKGEYEEAVSHYSNAIELMPDHGVYYLNRAMAYLKIGKYKECERDCSVCLKKEETNVKALWRRAVARKHLKRYKKAFDDIQAALNLDSENAQITKEFHDIETLLKKSLIPPRRRVPITEFGEFLSSEKSTRSNTAWKPEKPQSAFDFERDWKAVKNDANRVSEYLDIMGYETIPNILKNCLDADHVSVIVHALSKIDLEKDKVSKLLSVLSALTEAKRFDMIRMFLSASDRQAIKSILSFAEQFGDNAHLTKLSKLKQAWRIQ